MCTLHRGMTRGLLEQLAPETTLTGFVPKDPYAAGCLIEPPVSEPSAHGARPAATAAADPPEEPPGTRSGSHGFRVGP